MSIRTVVRGNGLSERVFGVFAVASSLWCLPACGDPGTIEALGQEQQAIGSTLSVSAVADTNIRESDPNGIYATSTTCFINGVRPSDGLLQRSCLIKWQFTRLPPGTTVTAARIVVNVSGASNGSSTQNYEVYRITKDAVQIPWASWTMANVAQEWGLAGAKGGGVDRDLTSIGTLVGDGQAGTHVITLNAYGVSMMQYIAVGATVPVGFPVVIDHPTNDDIVRISTKEDSAANAPRLEIDYTPPCCGG